MKCRLTACIHSNGNFSPYILSLSTSVCIFLKSYLKGVNVSMCSVLYYFPSCPSFYLKCYSNTVLNIPCRIHVLWNPVSEHLNFKYDRTFVAKKMYNSSVCQFILGVSHLVPFPYFISFSLLLEFSLITGTVG